MRRLVALGAALAIVAPRIDARADERDDAGEKATCAAKYQSAQRLRAAGSLTLARADLVRCAQPGCPAFVSKDCKTWLAEVDAELPTLVFAVLDAGGGDVPGAAIRVDGEELPGATDGLGHAIDPGAHVVAASAHGQMTEQRVVVRVGERARRIELRLPLATSPAEPGHAAASPRVPLGAYLLGGAGALGITIGSALWIAGSSAARTYNDDCATIGCSARQRDGAQALLVAGDVAWGLGLAAGAGALAIFLLHRRTPQAPSLSLAPTGVSLRGAF